MSDLVYNPEAERPSLILQTIAHPPEKWEGERWGSLLDYVWLRKYRILRVDFFILHELQDL